MVGSILPFESNVQSLPNYLSLCRDPNDPPFLSFGVYRMKVTTIAGRAGVPGFRDGTLSESLFNNPRGLCLDGEGNLLVADDWNHRIRKIDFDRGIVTTIAGGKGGFVDGNALEEARFKFPECLVVRGDTIYICDSGNAAVRKVEHGIVSTVTRTRVRPRGITLDTEGNILVIEYNEPYVKRIDTTNGSIHPFPRPIGPLTAITVSHDGVIYV